jgi:hypothetical protein
MASDAEQNLLVQLAKCTITPDPHSALELPPLLRLPAENRLKIYDHVRTTPVGIIRVLSNNNIRWDVGGLTVLARTCKILRQETFETCIALTAIVEWYSSSIRNFSEMLERVPPTYLANVEGFVLGERVHAPKGF